MRVYYLFLLLFVISCKSSSEYAIESKERIKIDKAEYILLPSGIKEGPTQYTVTLRLKETPKDCTLLGTYLTFGYAKLESLDTNVYRGGFSYQSISDDLESNSKKEVKEPHPFKLEANEAIVCYLFKGKKKYQKIPIRKLYSTQVPM